jgi:hypothetical protein
MAFTFKLEHPDGTPAGRQAATRNRTVLRRGGLAYGDGDAAIPTPSNRKRRTRFRYTQLADRAGASPGEHGAGAAQSALSPEATIMRCRGSHVQSPSGLFSSPVGRDRASTAVSTQAPSP